MVLGALVAITFAVGAVVYIGRTQFRISAPIAIFIFGMAIGALTPHNKPNNTGLQYDLYLWEHVSPQFLLQLPLPLLVFEGAFNSDTHVFIRKLRSILLLAGPGVLISTALIALVPRYLFVSVRMGWRTSLLFGAMLSATDPVSVVSVLRESGASEKLRAVVDGEALLNDGVGIVLFTLLQSQMNASVAETAAKLVFVSPVLGAVVGLICAYVAGSMFNEQQAESSLTLVACFSAFTAAEAAGSSGILAAVIAGLFLSHWGDGKFSPPALTMIHFMWEAIASVCNLLIFALSGIVITYVVLSGDINHTDWVDLIILYLLIHVARFVMIFSLTWLGVEGSRNELIMMSMSGLRGAVGLVLALSYQTDDDRIRRAFVFHMAGIAALTLIVNGSIAGQLLRYLLLIGETPDDCALRSLAVENALQQGEEEGQKITGVAPNKEILSRALQIPVTAKTRRGNRSIRSRATQRIDAQIDEWFEAGYVLPGDKRRVHAALHEWAEHGDLRTSSTLTSWIVLRELAIRNNAPDLQTHVEAKIAEYDEDCLEPAKERLSTFTALHVMAHFIRSQGLHSVHEYAIVQQISREMALVSSQEDPSTVDRFGKRVYRATAQALCHWFIVFHEHSGSQLERHQAERDDSKQGGI